MVIPNDEHIFLEHMIKLYYIYYYDYLLPLPLLDGYSSIIINYPLVIQHSHGKWPIYRWFTY